MATIRKFMFDRDFDEISVAEEPPEEEAEDAAEEEEEPEEDIPTFSEEDLARAREEGLVAGREQGIAEAAEATERRIAETLETVVGRLETLLEDRKRVAEQASRDAMAAGVAVVRKLFPALNRDHGLNEIESVIAEVVERCAEEPHLTIRVSGTLRDAVSERVAALAESRSFAGEISVAADDAMADGDCAVEWSDGGAFRDTERMWREIDEVVNRNLSSDAGPEPAGHGTEAVATTGTTGTDDNTDDTAETTDDTGSEPSEPDADAGEAGRGDADG